MPSITSVNLTHLHLLLNHLPTVGSVVALGLLLLAIVRRDEPLTRAGLEVLFAIAVLTLPVYMSGVAAHLKLRDRPEISAEISDTAMRVHQDAAVAGFTVTEFAGFLAWVALWQSRRRGRLSRRMVAAVLLLSTVALVFMTRAALLGGYIRHPEVAAALSAGAAQSAPGNGAQYVTTAISRFMVDSPWGWPAAESVHFLGLSLTFGVLLAVNLRILGAMRRVPFADVHRLLPWGMLGFGANLITGMLFFIGQPRQYIDSSPFYWKIVFLMIAGANFLYLTEFKGNDPNVPNDPNDYLDWSASPADKAMAVASIVAWLIVLYGGRMLPFIGHAF